MSLALEMETVPTSCQLEVNQDGTLDVAKNAGVLWQLANSKRVSFSLLAMPCRSWTLARKPMLRNLFNLHGEPWVARIGLWKQQLLVDDGNALLLFTALYIILLLRAQCRFAPENPLRSLAWWHPLLRWIARQKGVIYTHILTCVNMVRHGGRPHVSCMTRRSSLISKETKDKERIVWSSEVRRGTKGGGSPERHWHVSAKIL